jgi:threonine/homoserine/homoserine lactone efflux protein
MYIVARILAQGRAAGLVSVLGVALGNMICALAVALGIGVTLGTAPTAFHLLRYVGAAYLIYLGLRQLGASTQGLPSGGMASSPDAHLGLLREGLVVALSNPKTILFFAAFLPQFMPHDASPMKGAALGALFVGIALVTDSLYALGASQIATWTRGQASFGKWAGLISGVLLIALGLLAALEIRHQ